MPEVMAEVVPFTAAAQGVWGGILKGGKLKSDQHGLTPTLNLNPTQTRTRTRTRTLTLTRSDLSSLDPLRKLLKDTVPNPHPSPNPNPSPNPSPHPNPNPNPNPNPRQAPGLNDMPEGYKTFGGDDYAAQVRASPSPDS